MVYSRKPKNLAQFVSKISLADAQHTWEYSDKKRLAQVGSSAPSSFEKRRRKELERDTVKTYNQSRLATTHVQMRGEVVKFRDKELAKQQVITEPDVAAKSPPKLSERPIPNPPLFRRPGL